MKTVTTGEIAEKLKAPIWTVRRAIDRLGLSAGRAGRYRLILERDVPKIEAAIIAKRKAIEAKSA